MSALAAAGYRVFPVNPLQSVLFRQRNQVSGAKSDAGDAHVLADMVRTDFHQLREASGDSPEAAGIKVLARTCKTMIWERTRETQRLRHQLLEYYPAALEAFSHLDAPDTLELLGRAPDPRQPEADPRAGVRRVETGRAAHHHRAGHGGPDGVAQRPARPARGPHACLRRHGPVPHRRDHRAERAGQGPGTAGQGAWRADSPPLARNDTADA